MDLLIDLKQPLEPRPLPFAKVELPPAVSSGHCNTWRIFDALNLRQEVESGRRC